MRKLLLSLVFALSILLVPRVSEAANGCNLEGPEAELEQLVLTYSNRRFHNPVCDPFLSLIAETKAYDIG